MNTQTNSAATEGCAPPPCSALEIDEVIADFRASTARCDPKVATWYPVSYRIMAAIAAERDNLRAALEHYQAMTSGNDQAMTSGNDQAMTSGNDQARLS